MLVHSSEESIQQKLLNNIRTMCLTFSKSAPCNHIWLNVFMGPGGSKKGRGIQPLETDEVDHTGSRCYHTIILYRILVRGKRKRSRIYTASSRISSNLYWSCWLILNYHEFWRALYINLIKRMLCNPTNVMTPLPHSIITPSECPIEFSGAPIESIMVKPVELDHESLVGDWRWRTTISLPPR